MCGIAGIWNNEDDAAVAEMARAVAHRGPDGTVWMTKEGSSIGASRLVIVGDSTASAVFFDPETNVAVLFNGEIYNVEDLRSQLLAAGETLTTDLESEVLSRLYSRFGAGFAARLKGMFAVAIIDGNRLVLVRDRFGIKPLYYSKVGSKVLFGSEIKALLAHPELEAVLDMDAYREVQVFGYVVSRDKTMFQGIRQVEPGTVLTFHGANQIEDTYWNPPASHYLTENNSLGYEDAVAETRRLVVESVDSMLSHGGDNVGIYLSGGLDSTILTLVARCILGRPVRTFTLADETDSADLIAAREVAQRLDTKHIERRVTIDECLGKLRHFVNHYEAPMAGGVFDIYGGLAFHLLSETVSEHVRVALSGEGADELFGGYYWVYTHPLGFADRIRSRLLCCKGDSRVCQLVNDLFPLPEDERVYRRNLFDALIHGALSNYHLQSVDRSGGAFGFEIRPPYLSDDLAQFALDLPIDYKVPDKTRTKRILRDAFRPEFECTGLEWVLTRLKEGMPAALSHVGPLVTEAMDSQVSDYHFSRHPMRVHLQRKSDAYLFDLFSQVFHLDHSDALQRCAS